MALQESTNTLAEDNVGLVRAIARQMKRRLGARVDLEDLEAHGMEGLFSASRRFTPDRGATFTTFAWYRVRGAMLDALPEIARLRRAAGRDVEEELSDESDAETETLAREARARVRRALEELPARERAFIDHVYFGGEPLARAGARLGVSRSRASRLHGKAVKHLRRVLGAA